MVRIIVDPRVSGGLPIKYRSMRTLTYLAWIARDMGHDVVVRADPAGIKALRSQQTRDGTDGFAYLNLLLTMPFTSDADTHCDVLICTEEKALRQPRPSCKVAAWRTMKGGGDKAIKGRGKFDLLCSHVLSQPDWTQQTTTKGKKRGDVPLKNPLGGKWFQVPLLPFERTLYRIHKDDMWKAYLQDDLEAMRAKYGSPKKKRHAGFVGHPWSWRTAIGRTLDDSRFVFRWVVSDKRETHLRPNDYLRWLSECRLSLNLPGDTWACSRFAESAIMGVPIVHPRDTVYLTPPLTDDNAVLVSDWAEMLTWDKLDDLPRITANADKAYREGWSLRGQFQQMLRRLGI